MHATSYTEKGEHNDTMMSMTRCILGPSPRDPGVDNEAFHRGGQQSLQRRNGTLDLPTPFLCRGLQLRQQQVLAEQVRVESPPSLPTAVVRVAVCCCGGRVEKSPVLGLGNPPENN